MNKTDSLILNPLILFRKMESTYSEKPVKKIVKKIIRIVKKDPITLSSSSSSITSSITSSIAEPVCASKNENAQKLFGKWTQEELQNLQEYVKQGMTVSEMATELGKTESAIRFQLKVGVYTGVKNDVMDLIDGVRIRKVSEYNTENFYGDRKFLDMLNIYYFLDKVKDEYPHYAKLHDQVKKECLNKLREISNKS